MKKLLAALITSAALGAQAAVVAIAPSFTTGTSATPPSSGFLVHDVSTYCQTSDGTTSGTPIACWIYDKNTSAWVQMPQPTAAQCTCGDIKTGLQTADHGFWKRLDGRTHSCGSISTSVNASDRIPLQGGAVGAVAAAINIPLNALPNFVPTVTLTATSAGTPSGTVNVLSTVATMQSAGNHQHNIGLRTNDGGWPAGIPQAFHYATGVGGGTQQATTDRPIATTATSSMIQAAGAHTHTMNSHNHAATFTGTALANHTHTATASSINGGVTQQALTTSVLPSFGVNYFFCDN